MCDAQVKKNLFILVFWIFIKNQDLNYGFSNTNRKSAQWDEYAWHQCRVVFLPMENELQ